LRERIPHFIEVNNEFSKDPSFKMPLVSLDIARDKQKVINFTLTAEVVILNDVKRTNTWIPRFQKYWEGEI
jgi:hypothetical protein